MGRRPTVNLNLPKGMRARRRPNGAIYYFLDTGGKPRKEIPLGTDYVEAVRKWGELTITAPAAPVVTFKDVADRYVREILPTKAPRTQKDNLGELDKLLAFFNDPPVALDLIEPQHVRQYLDWRGATAKVRANREKALLSHIWNYARERGITALPNPCRGVKGFTEDGRDNYVEDEVLAAVYEAASAPLRHALDLAYLTGQRPADVLRMSATDHRDGFLRVKQGKTGAVLRLATSGTDGKPNELGNLLARIAQAKTATRLTDIALVCGSSGMRMTAAALDTAFDRAREKAMAKHPALAERIKAFQFRDLRAKAGTDKADQAGILEAQRQLGHASVTMTEAYVRLGQKVTPTR